MGNQLFDIELSKRIKMRSWGNMIQALHPGIVGNIPV